jgi:hypothetical protein
MKVAVVGVVRTVTTPRGVRVRTVTVPLAGERTQARASVQEPSGPQTG